MKGFFILGVRVIILMTAFLIFLGSLKTTFFAKTIPHSVQANSMITRSKSSLSFPIILCPSQSVSAGRLSILDGGKGNGDNKLYCV